MVMIIAFVFFFSNNANIIHQLLQFFLLTNLFHLTMILYVSGMYENKKELQNIL